MAGQIKGITIEFDGNTTKLQKAISDVKKSTNDVDKSLRQVDKALKLDPKNVTLLEQKQKLLGQRVNETRDKLKSLKDMQAQLDAKDVDKNSQEYQQLQREIIMAENELKRYNAEQKKIAAALSPLGKVSTAFKDIGNKATAAGQAMQGLSMAGAAVVASMGAMTYKSAQLADDINTMSKKYSISTGELQKYSLAAEQVDVSVDTIAKSHVKLEKNMMSAAQGSKTQAEAFDKLGVSYQNTDGSLRDGDAVWQDVISALGKMENETERDAIAMQLMGKSAADLNPLIEDNGETYKRVSDLFAKYNLDFIDQETLDRANEFNDDIDDIKSIGTLAFTMLGSQLAGYLEPALEKVVELVGRFAEWLSGLNPAVLAVIGAVAGVVAVLGPALIVIGKIAFAISSITGLMSTLGVSLGAIAGPVGIAIAVIAALVAVGVLLYKNWDTIKAKALELWNNLKTTFEGIKTSVVTVWNNIKTTITNVVNGIKTVISTVFMAIRNFIVAYVNAYRTIIVTVWNAIKSVTSTTWNAIKTAIQTPINAAKNAVTTAVGGIKAVINGIAGIVGNVRNAFNNIKNAMTSPITSAKTTIDGILNKIKGKFPLSIGKIFSNLKLPHISVNGGKAPYGIGGKGSLPSFSVSWYAKGGVFDDPTLIGVGEAGREILTPERLLDEKLTASNANIEMLLARMVAQNQLMIEELRKDKELKIDKRAAGRIVNELVTV